MQWPWAPNSLASPSSVPAAWLRKSSLNNVITFFVDRRIAPRNVHITFLRMCLQIYFTLWSKKKLVLTVGWSLLNFWLQTKRIIGKFQGRLVLAASYLTGEDSLSWISLGASDRTHLAIAGFEDAGRIREPTHKQALEVEIANVRFFLKVPERYADVLILASDASLPTLKLPNSKKKILSVDLNLQIRGHLLQWL